ncbi:MAG TPA: PDDEXK nuclease domain-containing protein [Thermoanaerobaculia bacterium]|nr:PDDEXK nuclease domain-containing protein [Thermoanaerobaculia bacterium]
MAGAVLEEVRGLILEGRQQTARMVNAGLTLLYWQIGDRIRREFLYEKRAGYGNQIVSALGRQLEAEFGRGFAEKNLRRMVQFAEVFPDREIVVSLIRQLTWTHFIALIPLKDPLQREFYAEMCRIERWSVRTLRSRIGSMLYERTALSKKPAKLIAQDLKALREQDQLTPDLVFRDPYVLDFLGLRDTYSEQDLESSLLREIELFLLELGAGFAFVERQKRITLDGDDYYLDLLFYHRRLQRLVVIELKIGDFKPSDVGQMELYLRWLDRHERQKGEEKPIGLILCAGKKRETVEVLELEPRGIHVAEYLIELPPRELLEQRLHEAVIRARLRLEQHLTEEIPAKPARGRKRRATK